MRTARKKLEFKKVRFSAFSLSNEPQEERRKKVESMGEEMLRKCGLRQASAAPGDLMSVNHLSLSSTWSHFCSLAVCLYTYCECGLSVSLYILRVYCLFKLRADFGLERLAKIHISFLRCPVSFRNSPTSKYELISYSNFSYQSSSHSHYLLPAAVKLKLV